MAPAHSLAVGNMIGSLKKIRAFTPWVTGRSWGALWATEEVLGDTGLVFHTFTQLTGMFDFLRGFPEGFTVSPAALRAAILDSMSET